MKKLLLLLLINFVLISCSKADEETENYLDPIIGDWVISKIVYEGETVFEAGECELKSTTTFNKNGTVDFKLYGKPSPIDPDGVCVEGSNLYEYYYWEGVGKGLYRFVFKHTPPPEGLGDWDEEQKEFRELEEVVFNAYSMIIYRWNGSQEHFLKKK